MGREWWGQGLRAGVRAPAGLTAEGPPHPHQSVPASVEHVSTTETVASGSSGVLSGCPAYPTSFRGGTSWSLLIDAGLQSWWEEHTEGQCGWPDLTLLERVPGRTLFLALFLTSFSPRVLGLRGRPGILVPPPT